MRDPTRDDDDEREFGYAQPSDLETDSENISVAAEGGCLESVHYKGYRCFQGDFVILAGPLKQLLAHFSWLLAKPSLSILSLRQTLWFRCI